MLKLSFAELMVYPCYLGCGLVTFLLPFCETSVCGSEHPSAKQICYKFSRRPGQDLNVEPLKYKFRPLLLLHYMFRQTLVIIRCLKIVGENCCASSLWF
jgi:hypothetical protein